MSGVTNAGQGGDIVFVAGITRQTIPKMLLFYAVIGLFAFSFSVINALLDSHSPGTGLMTFLITAGVIWAIISVFAIPLTIASRRRGVLTFYADRMERRRGGQLTIYSYDEISEFDPAAVTTANTTPQARPRLGGVPVTQRLPMFTFTLGGLRYRFGALVRTRDGGSFRDFIIDKLVQPKEGSPEDV